jgi:hypothetical protein
MGKRVYMTGNGLVDSYALSWPGGGTQGLTYEETIRVGKAKAKELGIPFVDESPRTRREGR